MRSDWIKTYLGNEISLQYGKALPKNDRLAGDHPVFGSNGVVGFHNEALVNGPGIIVGRKGSCGAVHFSTSDFWPIDTTYYVALRKDHDWRFMAFFLSTFGLCEMNLHSTIPGLNREDVYKLECLLPSLPEQQKIAAILFKIQQAIEVQESIIERLQELKKSTMQHVFTYGLRGEKTKETEIGRIPESWEVGTLEKLCVLKKETCVPNECQTKVYIGLEHIESGRFFLKRHGSPSEVQSAKHQFAPNDILYGKLRPYLDKAVVVNNYGICSTDILVLTPAKDVPAVFIVGLLHLQKFLDYAIQTTGGLNHPRTSWASLKKFAVPLPTVNDQLEIAHILKTLEEKIQLCEEKKSALQDLFKTMLNKLMTGEIRVRDLEVDLSEESAG
ncbi:MAG: restriction endonuclease subunit S [Thermodesulfobacteriota bacterium]